MIKIEKIYFLQKNLNPSLTSGTGAAALPLRPSPLRPFDIQPVNTRFFTILSLDKNEMTQCGSVLQSKMLNMANG